MFKPSFSDQLECKTSQINKTPTKQFQNSNKFCFNLDLKGEYSNTWWKLNAKENIYIFLIGLLVIKTAIYTEL